MRAHTKMNELIKIDPVNGVTAEEAIRLNTLKHQITTSTENFLTDIGAYFKEAHEILANHHKGLFREYIKECGYSHDTVDRLINRYNLVVANGDNSTYLETLPTRVLSAAGAKNAPPELTQAVVAGEIQNMKELEEFKAKYRAQMQRTMELSNALAESKEAIALLEEQVKSGNKEVVVDEQAIDAAVDEATKEYQQELNKKIEEARKTELLIEDKDKGLMELNRKNLLLKQQLDQLLPLKEKAEEIEKLQAELNKNKEEIRIIRLDWDIYKALRVAKESLHRDVFSLATIVRVPQTEIASNIKDEIRNIHELMQNFIIATTEKFQINR